MTTEEVKNTENTENTKINIWDKPYPKSEDQHRKEFDRYPFELDHFQKHAVNAMLRHENVLVTACTGSGKTLVAEFAIEQGIREMKKKVIYTSPIKSLSNQKFHEFQKKFPDLSIGILTGDLKFNPEADCLIMTTEILRNLLYHKEIRLKAVGPAGDGVCDGGGGGATGDDSGMVLRLDIETQVSAVIFDEVHYINDRDRGKVWEECLILLPRHIDLVLLSATIDQADLFGQWLQDLKQKPLNLIPTYRRVIPLKHYVYLGIKSVDKHRAGTHKGHNNSAMTPGEKDYLEQYGNKLVEIMDADRKYRDEPCQAISKICRSQKFRPFLYGAETLNNVCNFLKRKQMTPAIMFTLSRRKCQEYAHGISQGFNDSSQQARVEKLINQYLHQLDQPEVYQQLGQFHELKALLVKGIAYHHSGLVPVFKEIIELLFAQNLIQILLATETFAVGVNMPTKTVIFTGLTKYDGVGSFRYLESHEYQQMSGRAGRRGLDPVGYVIHLPNLAVGEWPMPGELRSMLLGRPPAVESKLTVNYQFILKTILTPELDLESILRGSYWNQQLTGRQTSMLEDQKELRRELKLGGDGDDTNCGVDPWAECREYQLLKDGKLPELCGLSDLVRPSQKQVKQAKKRAQAMERREGFHEYYKQFQALEPKLEQLQRIEASLAGMQGQMETELQKVLQLLVDHGYLQPRSGSNVDSDDNVSEYSMATPPSPEDVTIKGRLASQVSQCQELWLTEIICQGVLDNIDSPAELAAVLSVFMELKVDAPIIRVDRLQLPQSVRLALHHATEIAEQLEHEEVRRQIQMNSQWNWCLDLAEGVYTWASGESLQSVLNKVSTFEGNLIRDLLKLSHLALEVAQLAELLHRPGLAIKAEQVPALLVREVVSVDSLYLRGNV